MQPGPEMAERQPDHRGRGLSDHAFPAKANVAGIYRLIGLTEPGQIELVDDMTVRFHQAFPNIPGAAGPDHLLVPLRLEAPQAARDGRPVRGRRRGRTRTRRREAPTTSGRPRGAVAHAAGERRLPAREASDRHDQHATISSTANMRLQLAKGDMDVALRLSAKTTSGSSRRRRASRSSPVPSNNQVNVELNTKMGPVRRCERAAGSRVNFALPGDHLAGLPRRRARGEEPRANDMAG